MISQLLWANASTRLNLGVSRLEWEHEGMTALLTGKQWEVEAVGNPHLASHEGLVSERLIA